MLLLLLLPPKRPVPVPVFWPGVVVLGWEPNNVFCVPGVPVLVPVPVFVDDEPKPLKSPPLWPGCCCWVPLELPKMPPPPPPPPKIDI